ncbi:MAG: response regulator [Chloroflexi bacterium]|nr:response regulator [Chloroflexota bacterium]
MQHAEKKRILVVDDDDAIRNLVAFTLADETYEVLLARGGIEALRLAAENQPALLFLDVEMPDKNGFEVCREVKSDPRTSSATVVMLTALASESDIALGREAGADDYFIKPFSPLALLRKVEEILQHSDTGEESGLPQALR